MDRRRWEDLNVDCLVNVFGRVGMESLLLDVPFVCKSWYKASLNPSCWQCLIFPDFRYGFDTVLDSNTETQFRYFTPFFEKFVHDYRIDRSCFSTTAFVKLVVSRSNGKATSLSLSECSDVAVLKNVLDFCPGLKALSLSSDFLHWTSDKVAELIGKWKDLESFSLDSPLLDMKKVVKILSQISIHCKKFCQLHVPDALMFDKDDALAIVNLLPNIKYLSFPGANLDRENLVTLLQGCKELVALDVRNCVGFDEGDEEISKLASHITNFSSEGSRSLLYCYYYQWGDKF